MDAAGRTHVWTAVALVPLSMCEVRSAKCEVRGKPANDREHCIKSSVRVLVSGACGPLFQVFQATQVMW